MASPPRSAIWPSAKNPRRVIVRNDDPVAVAGRPGGGLRAAPRRDEAGRDAGGGTPHDLHTGDPVRLGHLHPGAMIRG
jgi:hypothetical protein